MKAIQITETGGPAVMEYVGLPDPTPMPNEVLFEIESIGVNFIDIQIRRGQYPRELPLIPGFEAAGKVAKVGNQISGYKLGDRVAMAGLSMGSYADKMAVPGWQLVRIPDSISFDTAAALLEQGLTAHYLCRTTYPLGPNDTCLIHAGAGGVGLLLIQMAKKFGATVITTVSTESKSEIAREAGADHVVLYTEQDFQKEVSKITGGDGIDVVYDSVGATTFDKSVSCLRPRGYMVLFGQASGPVPPIPTSVIQAKSIFVTRPGLNHYIPTEAELNQRAGELLNWVDSGELKVRIGKRYKLGDACQAHEDLENRRSTGKLILTP